MDSRAHPISVLLLALIFEISLYSFIRLLIDVSSDVAIVIAGLVAWSICTILVSERVGHRWARLKDYETLHIVGGAALIIPAQKGMDALISNGSETTLLTIVFAIFPVAAFQNLIRRVCFSPEERQELRTLRHLRRVQG